MLFRHEKTFFNKPGLAILITDTMADAEVDRRFGKLAELQFERVGLNLRPELVALKDTGNKEKFLSLVKKAAGSPYGIILMSPDAGTMKAALELVKDKKPLIYAATKENADVCGALAKEFACPLAVKGDNLDDVSALSEKLDRHGAQRSCARCRLTKCERRVPGSDFHPEGSASQQVQAAGIPDDHVPLRDDG